METQKIALALADLASSASDDTDMSHLVESFAGVNSLSEVRLIFRKEGIRWGDILEKDVIAILSGSSPQYFVHWQIIAERYRATRGILTPAPISTGVITSAELTQIGMRELERINNLSKRYGVSDIQWKTGYACFKEQQYFYSTREWQNRSKVARFIAGYQCKKCGVRGVKLHTHHLSPIITVYDLNFGLNFAGWNLRVLCEQCHKLFHDNTVRDPFGYDFLPASDVEVKIEKSQLKVHQVWHDENCMFCKNRIADLYPN